MSVSTSLSQRPRQLQQRETHILPVTTGIPRPTSHSGLGLPSYRKLRIGQLGYFAAAFMCGTRASTSCQVILPSTPEL